MKLSFCDQSNRDYFYKYSSWLITFLSFILLPFNLAELFSFEIIMIIWLVSVIGTLSILYFIIWQINKRRQSISFKINNTAFEIKSGDIFDEKNSLKVIPFNEYFDTDIEKGIISEKTLNGIFINRFYKNSKFELDKAISNSLEEQKLPHKHNSDRNNGKQDSYKLGTIAKIDKDYLLTALTHFDQDNNAQIEINEYFSFLMIFWHEIYKLYDGEDITMPIFGNGRTRFKFSGNNTNINSQKLIDLIIWTFKLSNIKLDSKITIIISDKNKDDINLLDFKQMNY
ncbi:MAG: DUF6430 domain-containing protein [Methanobrevibacter sp.]|jgi:hypothetical protein|nr:DUF6430 domain-containing protein [Candidatus Methanovirga procula]